MGTGPSKHAAYPFPTPVIAQAYYEPKSKWTIGRKSKKEKEQYYLPTGYPIAAAPYIAYAPQYYPQMQPVYPLPQHNTYPAFYPMAAVGAVIPPPGYAMQASHPAPAVTMPKPSAPMPAPSAPPPSNAMPAPAAPIPTPNSAPPQSSGVRMPEPYGQDSVPQPRTTMPEAYPPPGIVRMPEPPGGGANEGPVIPPPEVMNGSRSDNGRRPGFTNFYAPSIPTTQPAPSHQPVLPSHTIPPPQPAPLYPAPRPNPLPQPPADIWESTPYRDLLRALPSDRTLFASPQDSALGLKVPDPPASASRKGSLFGTLSGKKDKGKARKGLFRSFSTSASKPAVDDLPTSLIQMLNHQRSKSHTIPSFVIPATDAVPHHSGTGPTMPTPRVRPGRSATPGPSTLPFSGGNSDQPPIKFDHRNEYNGFLNHSPHRVLYEDKIYPTALHLLEALKFKHSHPDLADRIRKCATVNEVYTLSANLQEHVRPDWGNVFLKVMEEVLYNKFKQHPDLRTLLLKTGIADVIYADAHTFWGEGPTGNGANELGKALMRVRDKLRADGYAI